MLLSSNVDNIRNKIEDQEQIKSYQHMEHQEAKN